MMRITSTLRPVCLAAAVVVVSAVLTACVGSASGAPTTESAPSGGSTAGIDVAGTFDIGDGRMIYAECRGTGSPTVVLVSGLDAAGDLWDSPLGPSPRVFPTIAEHTRVCTYDRPGTT